MTDKNTIIANLNIEAFYRHAIPSLKANGSENALGRCCFHDDKNPSLSANLETGQFLCFACDTKGSVFDFYMKHHDVDFPTALKALAKEAGVDTTAKNSTKGKIVKIYDYTDVSGNLIHQTVRKEPKEFSQRRPDGNGGYHWNLKGVRTVLYNLPGIAKSERIIIVEGEKDADVLNALGLTATTCPMGADKWKPEYSECLRGKKVAIIPDNDEAGQRHIINVENALHRVVKNVRTIKLPGLLDQGADVSDWLAAGNTVDDLQELIKNTPTRGVADIITAEPEWPEPLWFSIHDRLPEFPSHVFPIPYREMIETVSEVNQIDKGLAGSSCLAVLSTAVAKRVKIDLKTHTEHTNVYMLTVADSGERKSATVRQFTEPIYTFQKDGEDDMAWKVAPAIQALKLNEKRLEHLYKLASKEEDEKKRKEYEKEITAISEKIRKNPVPEAPTILVDDITTERMTELMAENNGVMSMISAEGGAVAIMAGKYTKDGGTNFDIYLKAYSGDWISVDRISRGRTVIEEPVLTLSLSVQPEVMAEIGRNRYFRTKGFTSRLTFTICRPLAGSRKRQYATVPGDLLDQYHDSVTRLMNIGTKISDKGVSKRKDIQTHLISLSPDAMSMWDDYYNVTEADMSRTGPLADMKDCGSKHAGRVARLAGLLHLARNGTGALYAPIDISTVESACILGNYYKEHAIAAYGLMSEDPVVEAAKKIVEFLEDRKPTEFDGREVQRNKNFFTNIDEVNIGLAELSERGYIKKLPKAPAKPGRPPIDKYAVNPKIYEVKKDS